ncbi:hypothetical protein AB0O01_00110 [Streptomyces sp. NPDC093252]|uniref:hypothetical protein n=1 Tax=Streptomyces sp. NPDC093252 TaxID=3154980 RepID=UPI00341750AC
MEQYRTWLEVRLRNGDQDGPWQRHDEMTDPFFSEAPYSEQVTRTTVSLFNSHSGE